MATPAEVQQLYLVYFGRPADPSGLSFWTGQTSATQQFIASEFAKTPEYRATIDTKTFEQVVNGFYQSLFNRNAEVAGLNFWVGKLQRGELSTDDVGLILIRTALGQPATSVDNISVTSKLTAAGNFTTEVGKTTDGILAYSGEAGVIAGREFLRPVQTPATIPNATDTTAAVQALITSNPGGGGVGSNLDLSTFSDIFTASQGVRLTFPFGVPVDEPAFRFSAANETVRAENGTIQPFDQLIDPSTSDNDALSVILGTAGSLTTQLQANNGFVWTNIETLNFTLGSGTNGTPFGAYDFAGSAITGSKQINVAGAAANYQVFANFAQTTGIRVFDASGVTGDGTNEFGVQAFAGAVPGDAAVSITGSAVKDILVGAGGADTIRGLAGDDIIAAGAGNDTIEGGDGVDTIDGEGGNDTITGGTGADQLTGGAGNDWFVYSKSTDGAAFNAGSFAQGDRIFDFGTGSDRIRLTGDFLTGQLTGTTANAVNQIAFNAGINLNAALGERTVQLIDGAGIDFTNLADLNLAIGSINGETVGDERILAYNVAGGFALYYYNSVTADGQLTANELTLLASGPAAAALTDTSFSFG